MPGFNRKGPEGEGPLTGRGLGKCRGEGERNNSETENQDFPPRGRGRFDLGRGLARRRGRGFRRGNA
jgi:hypothetical protein